MAAGMPSALAPPLTQLSFSLFCHTHPRAPVLRRDLDDNEGTT